LKTLKILLGSKSPRRQQLLRDMGFDYTLIQQDTEESYPADLDVEEIAPYLARLKANSISGILREKNEIILTCDTTVICEGKSYEKPIDRDDAIRILSALSGKTHYVMTAVSLRGINVEIEFTEKTFVSLMPMSIEEIIYYIDHYQPFDKAGAYAIQEWIGLNKISKIEGSYSNVVGLPTHRLYVELKKLEKDI
jgi:septum formation protein